jgi:hypothetical protein
MHRVFSSKRTLVALAVSVLLLFFPLLALYCCLYHRSLRPPQDVADLSKTEDQRLVQLLKNAIDQGARPDTIEKMIGIEAILNTATGKHDRFQLALLDLDMDEEMKLALPNLVQEADVVIWRRPIPYHVPKVIGISWKLNGMAGLFYAELWK